MFSSRRLQLCSMAVDIFTRAVDTKCERVDPSSRTWHGVPIRYLLVRCFSDPSEVANVFPQASHTVSMERRTSLAAGTSAMKYTRTKNEQEIEKQETKNLKTCCCISENGQRHCQGESISFFSDGICPASHFKIYCAKKIEADATQSR